MLESQVTNTQNLPDPTFLEPCDCNKATTDSYTLCFLSSLPLIEIMAVHRSVLIESCVHIHILMLDDFEIEIWTVALTFPQFLSVNSYYLSLSFD
jgi:hypothetical protein